MRHINSLNVVSVISIGMSKNEAPSKQNKPFRKTKMYKPTGARCRCFRCEVAATRMQGLLWAGLRAENVFCHPFGVAFQC